MLDIQKLIISVMKKELFSETDILNKSARQVLAEIKTKFIDIREIITDEIQYKILKKLNNERISSIEIYRKAYLDHPDNENAKTNLEKSENELIVISDLMKKLEDVMPKQLSDDDVKKMIIDNHFTNIGECMKWFSKNFPSQDKKQISLIFKNI